ncbi:MAG: YkgJ family cysteine cluster protein [Thiovulaceae bacterium]|nr:YkgJ family cysteine cluster protein [Sulfurimonadaceae bacterium]
MEAEGFDFSFEPSACDECEGRCCTGESGYIFATKKEFEGMATLLELPMDQFIERYLIKTKNRFSIKEVRYNSSYDCIFFDRNINGCGVYEARPMQCRTFPFWDYFKNNLQELKDECPGITLKGEVDEN